MKHMTKIMKNILSIAACLLAVGCIEAQPVTHAATTNGVLIFLDDTERGYVAALSTDLLAGLLSEAGPIITSMSLLANLKKTELPQEKDPAKRLEIYNNDEDRAEVKKIALSITSFDDIADKWVIKKVSESLVLLLPKTFLQSKKIMVNSVETLSHNASITETEQALGFKVNHMETLTAATVTTPPQQHKSAGYFITALPSLFVANGEYANKEHIPAWGICMIGHGAINQSIVSLSLMEFRNFLTFLETKITTKLLFYVSCYATGVNTKAIYKDPERGIERTYPFTIITQSLTEAPNVISSLYLQLIQGKLSFHIPPSYTHFFTTLASADSINYRDLIAPFIPDYTDIASLPQIKIAGLSWFSVLDEDKFVSIGSVLAKSRTQPLDIATFFTRNKQKAHPLAILLYAQQVPFELIINTENMPAFVSMVPGSAVHRIKKISSATHNFYTILYSFITVEGLVPRKIFIIDQITAPFDTTPNAPIDTVKNSIIDTTESKITMFYTHDGIVYNVLEDQTIVATPEAQKRYNTLLELHGIPTAQLQTPSPRHTTQELMDSFKNELTAEQADQIIKDILDTMPDNSALRIPAIYKTWTESNKAWHEMLINLQYRTSPLGKHKVVWIDSISSCQNDQCFHIFRDIIIDKAQKGWFRILFKDYDRKNPISLHQGNWAALTEDYVPTYQKMFDYFDTHKKLNEALDNDIETIEKKSVHKQITPEHVQNIQALQEKKIKEQKARKKDEK